MKNRLKKTLITVMTLCLLLSPFMNLHSAKFHLLNSGHFVNQIFNLLDDAEMC